MNSTEDKASVCLVKDLPATSFRRVGVIPYKVAENGRTHTFVLGIDRDSQDVSNFAGSPKPPETTMSAMIREFEEESLGIFGTLTAQMLRDCIAIYNKRELIVFVRLTWTFNEDIHKLFNTRVKRSSEMSDIVFYDYSQLVKELSDYATKPIYTPVARLLRAAIQKNSLVFE